MKKLILFVSVAFISMNLNAQTISNDNLPAPVADAFKAKFSIAEKASWELDYDNYQADFVVGNANFSATFDKDGKWLKTEAYIKSSALPKVVKEFVMKGFSGYTIDDAEKVDTPDKGTFYQMEVAKDELVYELTISETGTMINDELKADDKEIKAVKKGSK